MNKIIRVCIEKQDDLKSVALSKGCIVLFFNENKKFTYGAATKDQGGGQYGEYHIIGYNDESSSWKFNVGNFKPFDGFYEEMENTASNFPDFDVEDAKKYIDGWEENSMYGYYDRFNRTVDSDGVVEEHLTKEDETVFGFDNPDYPGCPDESGKYYSCKLCLIKDIEGAEEHNGLHWYSENECDEDLLKKIESDNIIQTISKMIPGNIDFLK